MRVFTFVLALSTPLVIGALHDSTNAAKPPTVQSDDRNCVYPNPYAVWGKDTLGLAKAEYVSKPSPGTGNLRWLLISMGPFAQANVLTCNGQAIATLPLGYIYETKPGPVIGSRATLEVIAEWMGFGTGIHLPVVILLRFDGKRIVKLWEHDSQYLTGACYAPSGNTDLCEVDNYSWHYSRSGTEITVSSTPSVDSLNQLVSLHREKYCYRTESRHFERCN